MFLLDNRLVYSASDLKAAAECEFALLRQLDAKLGRVESVAEPVDSMLERAKVLGDAHELRQLADYRDRFGVAESITSPGVVEFERPPRSLEAIQAAAEATVAALRGAADVVFQGVFFDGSFIGYADFLVRNGDRIDVYDTKLARTARVTALLQLGAYADQLESLGIMPGDEVHLLLGDGSTSTHRLRDVLPVYRLRRDRLVQILDERMHAAGPVEWLDPRYSVCGRCATCELEVERHRDLLLVAGMRTTQRERLMAAGISTIDELAASTGPVDGLVEATLSALRAQARLQLHADPDSLAFEVFEPKAIEVVPPPDPGDIFFDFEGDPLYSERLAGRVQWNLDYLFGVIEHGDDGDEVFRPFWAHDFAGERQALVEFLDYVQQKRRRHPDMHIYHYAAYERTHLQQLCARHGVGEDQLDELLRDNVLVDLYPVVKRSTRISSRSYSLKKLEPLYMGDELRESEVKSGADSVDAYIEYRRLRDNGDSGAAKRQLAEIADYNRYDCLSTLRLRDWLLARAAEQGVRPLGEIDLARDEVGEAPHPLRDELRALAGDPTDPERSSESTALALTAAAIDFHRRERKSFWWEHFNRLTAPIDDWQDSRDVLVVESAVVEQDWRPVGRAETIKRDVRLVGRLAPGSRLREEGVTLVYAGPGPFVVRGAERGVRPWNMRAEIIEIVGENEIVVRESLPPEAEHEYADVPCAVTPGRPIPHGSQEAAIAEFAEAVLAARRHDRPGWPAKAGADVLLRRPPRGAGLAPATGDRVDAIVSSLLGLDDSYLAVQGPPGTGKTWVGSRVIARLVRDHGWRVGVVAQSHQVVEHMLARIVDAGLDISIVGKKVKKDELRAVREGSLVVPFTPVDESRVHEFAAEHPTGFVLGGTAWDFCNPRRVARGSLDLLVIDEAGQFSLADTIACGVAARNLMLLGDPQQLPQVSQGLHPEPVDRSALGWIADGHEVLPADRGYFLAESWRMHPAVAGAVSWLSYGGELRSNEVCTTARHLTGIEPGLHPVAVEHSGDTTWSDEEARVVVELTRRALASRWSAPDAGRDASPLSVDDLIVVVPYNAHVEAVSAALESAGIDGVRVGTVDRFQGQEAVVAIVSLAASSAADVPRGVSFLLLQNRLNVAVSRAQWAAFLVYSPGLLDHLPRTPEALAQLSAFATLVGAASR